MMEDGAKRWAGVHNTPLREGGTKGGGKGWASGKGGGKGRGGAGPSGGGGIGKGKGGGKGKGKGSGKGGKGKPNFREPRQLCKPKRGPMGRVRST